MGRCIKIGLTTLLIFTLLILLTGYSAAIDCRPEKGGVGNWWSWRIIDGRKCWYAGRSRLDKQALHWPRATPPRRVPPAPAPDPEDRSRGSIQATTRTSTEAEVEAALRKRAEELRATPWPTPVAVKPVQVITYLREDEPPVPIPPPRPPDAPRLIPATSPWWLAFLTMLGVATRRRLL